jgi:hypothetical protein
MITGREEYEWLVPSGDLGNAHVFAVNVRLSLCLKFERVLEGDIDWGRQVLRRGEPRRARCFRCEHLVGKFPKMREVTP